MNEEDCAFALHPARHRLPAMRIYLRDGLFTSLTGELAAWAGEDAARRRLAAVVETIAVTGARLADVVAVHPLRQGYNGTTGGTTAASGQQNPSGDVPTPLDLHAERVYVEALRGRGVRAVCSEETPSPIPVDADGGFVVALDPVDGSSNVDVNGPVGTIFSVMGAPGPGGDVRDALLRPGRTHLAAGMVVYGPATVLVLTVGQGTDVYALDPRNGDFRLARRGVVMPEDSREYAINASNARHWGPGVSAYVADLVRGEAGPRGRDVNMRWTAALVAEAYRILTRGGIYLYPADGRPGYSSGRIRLVYEANPVAMLVEQAGGAATDGAADILDLVPADLHERVPFVFGSRTKVERVRRYLDATDDTPERSPLFATRGLFRA